MPGRAEGGPRERRFDRPRREATAIVETPSGTDAGDPARERKFDRPGGRVPQPGGSPATIGRQGAGRASSRLGGGARGRPAAEPRSNWGRWRAARERRFDRPEAKRDGDRRERPPSTRGGGDAARERKFDRPQAGPALRRRRSTAAIGQQEPRAAFRLQIKTARHRTA